MKKQWIFSAVMATVMLFASCTETMPSQPNTPTNPDSPYEDSMNPGSENNRDHVDVDDDGFCDDCQENVMVTLDVFSLNDLHGKFADTDTQPGVDELTTYLKAAKANNENTLFLSSGDMWQGSSESNLTKGAIITEWMNDIGFSAMTIGNHEYDWGEEYIAANAELAEFPLLAINIFEKDTDKLVDYCQSSVMVEFDQIKVGVIGAIGDCYSSISADQVKDVYFKTGSELTALVKEESVRLRGQGADFIIYSIHDGYDSSSSGIGNISNASLSYYDIALSDGYVDMVFEGHTHQRYTLVDSKGVYHLQDGGDNDGVSRASVLVNCANGKSNVTSASFVSTSEYASLADDVVVQTLLGKYAELITKAEELLGVNDVRRSSDQIRTILAQLYYEAGKERWGEEYDIVLGGGYMSVRSPYNLAAGIVKYGDLMSLLPFDNSLVLCTISGRNLRNKFFQTSNENYFIYFDSYGESIKNSLNLSATYYIITDTYSSSYAPNGLTEVARYDNTTFARDLLAQYIKDGGLTAGSNDVSGDDVKEEKILTSIPELLAIGGAIGENEETLKKYYVRGTVVSVANTTYGNLTIEDEDGNRLYVYGVYDENGQIRYDGMSNPPQVGDTIVLYGAMKNYVNGSTHIVEMVSGRWIASWMP